MACQLIEKYPDFNQVVLVGLQPRGIFLLDRLVNLLEKDYALGKVISGKLDITFFRDDFRRFDKTLSASSSQMEVTIEGKSGANGAGPISTVCPYLSIIELAEEDNSTPAF